jgi:uncharacterized membrane protein YjgN (DUF898 family)
VLTLGLWFPRFARDRQQFLTGSTRFGVTSFECEIRPGPYYQAFFAAGILFWIFQVAGSIAGSGLGFGMGGRIVAAYAGLLVGLTLGRAVIDAITMNAAYNGTSIAGHRFVSKLDAGQLMSLYFSNLLLTVITAGIYYPWAAVRVARYRLEHLSVEVNGDLDEFVAGERKSAPATGDELGELLDVDLGL